MSILLKLSKGNYAGPNDQSKDFESETLLDTHNPNVIAVRYRTAAISLFLAVMVGAMGFWLGQNTCQPRDPLIQDWLTEKTDNFHSVEPFFRTFTYNGTFASAPSKETNLAWDSLFPGMLLARDRMNGVHTLIVMQMERVSSKTRQAIWKWLVSRCFISSTVW